MFKKITAFLFIVILALLPLAALHVAAAPQATTRYVAVGGTNGVNDCANANNPCGSVAYAVQQTDAGDTVHIASGTYTETSSINIFRNVTIRGEGLDKTIVGVIADTNVYEVFLVYGGTTAEIEAVSIHNAERSGVKNLGQLTLNQVSIFNNRGVLGGGGIYNTGVLTATDIMVSNNQSTGSAAGMMNFGTATIRRALFVNNETEQFSSSGGLHNQGEIVLENVTFAYNKAAAGTAVTNVSGATMTMTHVTIANNENTLPGATDAVAVTNDGTMTVVNTIIADNGPNTQCSSNNSAVITSLGSNIDSHNNCHFNQASDKTFTSLNLNAWASVSGTPNWVSALMLEVNSPALDAGNAAYCPTTDARGVSRPKGAGCDIGAYEFDNYRVYLPMMTR